jgi:hypothetical protein
MRATRYVHLIQYGSNAKKYVRFSDSLLKMYELPDEWPSLVETCNSEINRMLLLPTCLRP